MMLCLAKAIWPNLPLYHQSQTFGIRIYPRLLGVVTAAIS